MLNAVKLIRKLKIDALAEDVAGLEECSGPLMKIMRKSIWLSTGALSMDNPVTLLLEYLKMFFHIDLIIINHLIEFFKENVTQVEKMRKILGNIDASIAAGSYRLSLAKSCEPDFVDEGSACLEVKDCIHPLVENAVANSIKTDGPILLTGSNASGKSTFLKTVAISALMAQTLGYVPASYYRATRFEIFTSMALSDSILSGESYFMVEIRSLKRILDAKKDGKPVLCCIDEVLRGTNTVERIAASTHILKSLKGKAYIPFAATHDLELTHILEGEYANYHFDEEITDNDVRFNYMLREGRTGSRNAIKLLGLMEYDRNIVDDAGRMVDDFLSSGKWPQGEVRDAG
jgi:DNA mismatch repair ATPase MutS